MATITATKSGKYRTRITVKEGAKTKQIQQTFNTKKEALKFAKLSNNVDSNEVKQIAVKEKQAKIKRHKQQVKRDKERASNPLNFANYFLSWYEAYKEPRITVRTKQTYKRAYKALKEYFKGTLITDITRLQYQQFMNWFGSKYAKITVSKTSAIIKACVRNAMYDDVIRKNFTEAVTLSYNTDKVKRVDYLSMDELEQLINHVKGKLDPRYPANYLILTAIFTGARLGELLALKWDDIDFNHHTIAINKSWNYNTNQYQQTKTVSSNRVLKVNEGLLDALKELKDNHTIPVFESPIYGKLPSSSGINKQLKKNLAEIGLVKQGYHFHSLRHTHASFLLVKGFDIYSVSKRLGHSDVSITSKVYAYEMQELKAKNDDKFESVLNTL